MTIDSAIDFIDHDVLLFSFFIIIVQTVLLFMPFDIAIYVAKYTIRCFSEQRQICKLSETLIPTLKPEEFLLLLSIMHRT